MAALLAAAAQRDGGLAARYGGEEFAVLLPGIGLAGALQVAEQLREGIEALAIPNEAAPLKRITASFGVVALTPAPGQRRRGSSRRPISPSTAPRPRGRTGSARGACGARTGGERTSPAA